MESVSKAVDFFFWAEETKEFLSFMGKISVMAALLMIAPVSIFSVVVLVVLGLTGYAALSLLVGVSTLYFFWRMFKHLNECAGES